MTELQQSNIHNSHARTRFAHFLGGKWQAPVLIGIGAILATVLATQPHAQNSPIKIALIADKTGFLRLTPSKRRPDSPWDWTMRRTAR